jgi:hypothetical protein
VKHVRAWFVFAVAGLGAASVLGAASGRAADMQAGEEASKESPDELKDKFGIDASLDATSRRSTFGTGSISYAPAGTLDKSGPRVKIEGVNGGYYYNQQGDLESGQPPLMLIHGHSVEVSALFGYEYIGEVLSVAGLLGSDYKHESLSFEDPTNPSRGTHWGLKFATDIDYRPIESVAVSLSGSYSTADRSWWSILRPGLAVTKDIFIGPEVGYQGDNFYQMWRIGGHVSGLKVGDLLIGLSCGFARNSVTRNGAYGGADVSIRFP